MCCVFFLQKSTCPEAERSFSVAIIGDLLASLVKAPGGRGLAGRLSNRLLPVVVAGTKDPDKEVRNNSVYALGCLAEAAGPIVASYLSTVILLLCYYNAAFKKSESFSLANV